MRNSVKILLALAALGSLAAGPASAQYYYGGDPGVRPGPYGCPPGLEWRSGTGRCYNPYAGQGRPYYRGEYYGDYEPRYRPQPRYYQAPRGRCPPGYEWRSGTGRCYRL
jgi:hypothetical protein